MLTALKNWWTSYRYHVLVWVGFSVYEYVFGSITSNQFVPYSLYSFHILLEISVFYLNVKFFFPLGFESKYKVLKLFLVLLIEVTVYILLLYVFTSQVFKTPYYPATPGGAWTFSRYVIFKMTRFNYFLTYSLAYYFIERFKSERKFVTALLNDQFEQQFKNEKIKQKILITQGRFLYAQINPEFLFDTLNHIKQKNAYEQSDVGEVIELLKVIMGYAISSTNGLNKPPLEEEIEQIHNLLKIYQLKGRKLNIEIFFDDNLRDVCIVPLVAITLVENIIKHGNLSTEKTAYLKIFTEGKHLIIKTKNHTHSLGYKYSLGNGLNNIFNRLKLAYKNKADFYSGFQESDIFVVKIKISIPALENNSSSKKVMVT